MPAMILYLDHWATAALTPHRTKSFTNTLEIRINLILITIYLPLPFVDLSVLNIFLRKLFNDRASRNGISKCCCKPILTISYCYPKQYRIWNFSSTECFKTQLSALKCILLTIEKSTKIRQQ
ncbi:UNVERIFIED_CONTAM: hypothetical protein NCL1_14844 [Trichonephila clavipes]